MGSARNASAQLPAGGRFRLMVIEQHLPEIGASKIWHAIDELNQAIKDIRDTIFNCNGHARGGSQVRTE